MTTDNNSIYNANLSSTRMKKVVVMIPAFNEEKTIGKVIERIPKKIKGIDKVAVLVMDDHSSDNTAETAKKAGAEFIFRQKANRGLGVNFRKGIEKALELGADIIVNIDADNQFNPNDIPNLIEPILNGEADMVTASRFLDKKANNMPLLKKWGNKRYAKLIGKITGQTFSDVSCGFRAYSREAALKLNLQGKFTYTQESFIDLAEKGMRIKEVPSEVNYFKDRNSKISGKLAKYGMKSLGIIAKATRDTQPLSFFGIPGLILFLLGAAGAGFSFFYWLTHLMTTPVRQLFNVSVFFIIFGLSLAVLGLLADMIKSLKTTQDEVLYRLKKQELSEKLSKFGG